MSKAELLLNAAAQEDVYFTERLDATKYPENVICPKAKFLMAMKCLV